MIVLSLFSTALAVVPAPVPRLAIDSYQSVQSEWCCPSGLRVQARVDPGSGLVRLTTVVGAGTADGAAHLVQHLWFRSGAEASIEERIRAAGLVHQFGVDFDVTTYHLVGPPDRLPEMLAIAGTLVTDPLEGVDAGIVADEWARLKRESVHRNRWEGLSAEDYLTTSLFPSGHRYHHIEHVPVGDPPALDDLVAWTEAHYHPLEATMVLSGDLELGAVPEALRASIDERTLFLVPEGRSPDEYCPVRTPAAVEPPPLESSEPVTVYAPVTRASLHFAWSMPSAWREDEVVHRTAVQLLETVVYAAFKERAAWGGVRDVDCDYLPGELASMAHCHADLTDKADVRELLRLFRARLDESWAHDVSERRMVTLHRLLEYEFGDVLRDLDGAMGRSEATKRAHYIFYTGEPDYLAHRLEHLFEIDDQFLARQSRRWFARDRVATLIVLPRRAMDHYGPDVLPSAESAWSPGPAAPLPELRPVFADAGTRRLDNGLEILAVPRTQVPYVRARLVFPAGSLTEPEAGAHMALNASTVWRSGVSISRMSRELGGFFTSTYGSDSTWLEASGSSANLSDHLQLVRHVQSVTQIETEERQLWIDDSIVDLFSYGYTEAWLWAEPFRYTKLFPRHAHGVPWWLQARDARRVGDRTLYRWQRSFFRPDVGTLVVAGRLDVDEALDTAERWFRRWHVRAAEPLFANLAPPAPPERTLGFLAASVAPSEVTLSCRLPERTAERAAAQDLLVGVLQEGLHQSLVVRTGVTFEPSAWLAELPGASVLHLQADVHPDSVPATLRTLVGLVKRVAEGTVPDEAIAQEKPRVVVAHRLSHGAATYNLVSAITDEIAFGRDPRSLDTHAQRIASVTAADLAAQVQGCVGHEVVTVVGPREPLEELLEPFGPVEVDWLARRKQVRRDYGPPEHQR